MSETYPEGGRLPAVPVNARISRVPMKKSGTETPSWLTTRAAPSTQVSWRTAASTPSGNAITTPMIMPGDRQRQRRRQPLEEDLGHRLSGLEAHPQVAGERVAEVAEVLHHQGLVKARALAERRVSGRVEPDAEGGAHRVAGHQVDQGEDDEGDAEQHDHRLRDAPPDDQSI